MKKVKRVQKSSQSTQKRVNQAKIMLLVRLKQLGAACLMTLLMFNTARCARSRDCQQVAFNLTSTCFNSRAVIDGADGCLESCRERFEHLFQIIGHGSDGRLRPVDSTKQRPGSSQGNTDFENQQSIRNRLWAVVFHFEPCLARRYMCLNNIQGQIMSSVPPRTHLCGKTSCLDSSSPVAVGAQRCFCRATFRLERAYLSWKRPLGFGPFRCDTESICKRINHLLTLKFSCVDHTVIESDLACSGHVDGNCPCNKNGNGVCTQIGWPSPGSQPDSIKISRDDDPPEGFDDAMESYNRYLCHMTPAWAKHYLDSVLVNQIFGCDVGQADRFKRIRSNTAADTSTGLSDLSLQYAQPVEGVGGSSETCFTSRPSTFEPTSTLDLAASVPYISPGFGNALGFGNIDFDTIESNQLSQLQHGQQPAIMDLGFAVLNDHSQQQALRTDVASNVGMEWPPGTSPICPWPETFYGTKVSADEHAQPTFQWRSNEATFSNTILDWRQELQLQSAQSISSLAPGNRLMTTSQLFHFDDLLTSNTFEQMGSTGNDPYSSVDIFSELSAMITPQRVTANLSPQANAEVADDNADDDILSEEIAAQLLGFL